MFTINCMLALSLLVLGSVILWLLSYRQRQFSPSASQDTTFARSSTQLFLLAAVLSLDIYELASISIDYSLKLILYLVVAMILAFVSLRYLTWSGCMLLGGSAYGLAQALHKMPFNRDSASVTVFAVLLLLLMLPWLNRQPTYQRWVICTH